MSLRLRAPFNKFHISSIICSSQDRNRNKGKALSIKASFPMNHPVTRSITYEHNNWYQS
ncbi:hypothetical protein F383_16288 [Gossypium arboreum]|uniref:Uncharacterized protein n=1 Tax=Gossypium arboreum TaxID=29729 RepID=A0A0B0N8S5_GOSAR|nr:hypothetical protein F383_16288 [Gossypium arboreum]